VVLVHGALCDYRYWEPQLAAFAPFHLTIAVSLRGFYPVTSADLIESFSADRQVLDLGEFLSNLGEPVHLVGHSRGGRIALHVAARFPQFIRSLILAEPGGLAEDDLFRDEVGPGSGRSKNDARREAAALIESGQIEAGLELYIDDGQGPGAWRQAPENFRRIAKDNVGTLRPSIDDRTAPLSRSVASAVSAPTLLIAGDQSPGLFLRIVDAFERCIPDATRVIIPGTDHFLTAKAQASFNRAAMMFWASCK